LDAAVKEHKIELYLYQTKASLYLHSRKLCEWAEAFIVPERPFYNGGI